VALDAVRAAGVSFEEVPFDLGGERYLRTGDVLPGAALEEIRGLDAVLLGAVGTPDVPPGVIERGLLLRLRFELDLYVNLRPFHAGPGRLNDGVDLVVVRENTEGTYAGRVGSSATDPARGRHEGRSNPLRRGALRPLAFESPLTPRRHLPSCTSDVLTSPSLWQRTSSRSPATSRTSRPIRHVVRACITL